VFGFVGQSSFFIQLRYGARLLKMKPSLSGSGSSSGSTAQVCSKRASICQKSRAIKRCAPLSPAWPDVYANAGPFVQFLNIIEASTTLSSIFYKNFQ
jgi:hypothetical protein